MCTIRQWQRREPVGVLLWGKQAPPAHVLVDMALNMRPVGLDEAAVVVVELPLPLPPPPPLFSAFFGHSYAKCPSSWQL